MLESDINLQLVRQLQAKIQNHGPCRGYGYVLKDRQKVMCSCREEALFQFRLAQSGIPPKFKNMGFKEYAYKESEAYKTVQGYLSNAQDNRDQGTGLYLYGPSYTGKSLLACSLLIELMKRGYDCKFHYFDTLLNGEEKNPSAVIAGRWDFICIDRVGDVLNNLSNFKSGAVTGERIHGAVEFLRSIISTRVNAGRPIIITSSVSLKDVDQVFPGLASTLLGSCVHVMCEDKGFRKRKLEQMLDD